MGVHLLDTLIPFVSIIGVIIGFVLALIKEYFQNKPRLKVRLNSNVGLLNYFHIKHGVFNTTSKIEEAELLEIKLKMDVYNIGKAGTAIKDIRVMLSSNGNKLFLEPDILFVDESETKNFSFNVGAGCIRTVDINLTIQKENELHGYLFDEDISFNLEDNARFKIIPEFTDIYGRSYKQTVEPISIYGATD
jgi:hypothetical protein